MHSTHNKEKAGYTANSMFLVQISYLAIENPYGGPAGGRFA